MKKFLLLFLLSPCVYAWGPYFPGPSPMYGWGFPPGFGYGGYVPFIPAPSFNYTTTIVSPPPIIIQQTEVPTIIYRERESPHIIEENERLRRYFGK